jgi:hypothetical protein
MHIQTTTGQIAMVGGNRREQSGSVLVEEPVSRFARGRGQGNLYILVDVSGEEAGRDIIAGQLARIVHDIYYNRRGSVTAGLQQALREANSLLYDENRNSLPGDRRTAGVSCVVLRDDNLFVAQVGPAAVYLAQAGQVTRFPDISPWLNGVPPEDMEAAALGERRDVNVALFHTQVRSGDTFLVVDGDLAGRVPVQRWSNILAPTSIQAILDRLEESGEGCDLSALVVALDGEAGMQVATQPAAPATAPGPPDLPGVPVGERVSLWLSELRLGERLGAMGQTLAAVLVGVWASLLGLLKRLTPGRIGPQPPPSKRPPPAKKPGMPRAQARRAGVQSKAPSEFVQKALIGVAIAIPLLVAVIVLMVFLQRGQSHRAELDALWQEASAYWDQAQATSDVQVARTLLTNAEASLEQLLTLRSDHVEALELQKKIGARLDVINRVQRVSWIAELQSYPANAALSRVVVHGFHIFVMDRRNGKVYHHELDESQKALKTDAGEPVLLSKGAQVGDILVGDLVDMVWMPTGPGRQKEGLLILESGGGLIEYDPTTGELLPLKVANADTWVFADMVGSHFGRFYVLDSGGNEIWRYGPTIDGYSSPPDKWLQSEVDLLGVQDMAIGDSIYLVYADDKIRKLSAGQPDTFDTSDWDMPARNPSAVFTRPPEEVRSVYVADPGNSRIVQSSKEGKFERQFRLADPQVAGGSDPLTGVTSLFVDESIGRAYFLSGQKLYLVIWPD